ncbi:TonB-dependent receptor [Bacteroidota bacterium]
MKRKSKTKRGIFFNTIRGISSQKVVFSLLVSVLLLLTGVLKAETNFPQTQQLRSISGKVTDTTGVAIPGVTVNVVGTTKSTITDIEGKYQLTNLSQSASLTFTFMGMKSQTINITDKDVINVVMKEESIGIDGIVVVGYSSQRKVNLTGSVSTVRSEELTKVPTANISDAIVGKAPGLFAKQDTGVPGSDYSNLSIRGFGSPLILVDGIETSWTRMDPSEIESISVLKDAAAAIYGARAGNGVILITTKRGVVNKPSITYSLNTSFQSPTTIPEFVSSAKYAELLREGQFNYNLPFTYSEEDIAKFKAGNDPDYINENWYNAAFRKWSPMQSHTLSVRGGNDNVKYYITVGYLNQSGTYKSGDLNFSRYNVRSNVDAQITKRLSASIDLSYRNEIRNAPQTSLDNIWINLKTALPVWRATLPDPDKGGAYSGFLERSPVAQTISKMTGFNYDLQRYLTGKISLKYKIPGIEGLEANASLNYSVNNKFSKVQDKPFNLYSYDYKTQTYIPWGTNGANRLDEQSSLYTQLYPLLSLNYDRKFNDHSVQGLLLAEAIDTDFAFLSAGRVDLLSLEVPYLFAGSPENLINNGGAEKTGRMSYVGRGNYSYKGKYLLEGTFRFDASHKFPSGSRWGFFPSVSAGWRLSEEPFIKENLPWVDNLKLRLSYSKAGNDNVEAFKYLTGYEIISGTTNVYVFGSDVYRLIRSTGLPNEEITWLDMTSYNAGLDASFLKGKLSFELDFFWRITENIFGQPLESYPSTFGATLPQVNLNSTDDRGFELKLTHRNSVGSDFSYNLTGSFSLARERYRRWSENPYDDPDEIRIFQKTGKFTNRWIGYKSDGLFMSKDEILNHPINQDQAGNTTLKPGDIRYKDLNDDKVIDWRDQDVIGYGTFPDITFGLNIDLRYKNFSLSALFQGASLFNSMIADAIRGPLTNQGNAFEFQYKHRWQPDLSNPNVNINPNVKLPAIYPEGTNNNNNKASDFWLQDATYLRLKNLNISYTLPEKLVKAIGFQDINLFVAGNNLLTLSKLGIYKKSIDPEATDYQKFYPPVKTVSFGINVTL